MASLPTTLIDTREAFDAELCGYDGPADPHNSFDGLIVEFSNDPPDLPTITITDGNGSVQLVTLPEIREVAKSLASVVEQLTRAAKHNPKEEYLL